jgi:CheY-like chemotaxis protein
MSDEVRERAFEPFFTTKEAGRGTGLGLSTVYGFARQSRGAVGIESRPGAGTTLTLFLPRPWQTAEPAAPRDDGTVGSIRPGLQVLLVEDDADVREVVCGYLDALGCRVRATANAEQALLTLASGAEVDLLLTDVALGSGMRGTELARRARQRLPDLPVLLKSGFSPELLAADRGALPDTELLRKPYTREELAAAIARATAPRAPPTAA